MFKFLGSLAVVLALVVPSYATHCGADQVVERIVSDYHYNDVEAVVLVPHAKLVNRLEVRGYDYQPQVVERIVERIEDYPTNELKIVERQVVRRQPVRDTVERVEKVVKKVVQPKVRVRQRVVKKEIVEVQKVQKVRSRNFERVRQVNGY